MNATLVLRGEMMPTVNAKVISLLQPSIGITSCLICRLLLDIDECAGELEQCSNRNDSHCQNMKGSFECICNDGYKLEDGDCKSKVF